MKKLPPDFQVLHGVRVLSLLDLALSQPLGPPLLTGKVNLPKLRCALRRIEADEVPPRDEKVWTYLCTYGYAAVPGGLTQLAQVLLGQSPPSVPAAAWVEVLPFPPRKKERNTELDLALGDLSLRSGAQAQLSKSGIEFAKPTDEPTSWIAFVEAKVHADISSQTTHDPLRNQLMRVIENALTFRQMSIPLRGSEREAVPANVYVVLLTPRLFRDHPKTRLYGYKFTEYSQAPLSIVDELKDARGCLRPDCPVDIASRVAQLRLRWVTYEEVILQMPDTPFRTELIALGCRSRSLLELQDAQLSSSSGHGA